MIFFFFFFFHFKGINVLIFGGESTSISVYFFFMCVCKTFDALLRAVTLVLALMNVPDEHLIRINSVAEEELLS